MDVLRSIDRQQRNGATVYAGVLLAVAAAAWMGWVPGAGQVYPGQPLTAHPYRMTMAGVCGLLAIWLGLQSAAYGIARGSLPQGMLMLLAGGVFTGLVLGLAPYTLFPNDQYPISFMWVMLGAPSGLTAWLVASVLLRHGSLSSA